MRAFIFWIAVIIFTFSQMVLLGQTNIEGVVKNIVDNKYSRNVVETIVSFAQKQDIVTIAEFVENEEIFNILNDLGVDYSQGYYFGKPENIVID